MWGYAGEGARSQAVDVRKTWHDRRGRGLLKEPGQQSIELSQKNCESSRIEKAIYHTPDEGEIEKRHCVEDGGSI
jgi:hypothetical protein